MGPDQNVQFRLLLILDESGLADFHQHSLFLMTPIMPNSRMADSRHVSHPDSAEWHKAARPANFVVLEFAEADVLGFGDFLFARYALDVADLRAL